MISPWFVRPKPNAGLRLFCFAHAGGAASAFHPWGAKLEGVDVWAIQLPGREGRLSEPLLTDFTVLQDRLARELTPHLDRPFAFFGHSMGAILAYEIARELRQRRLPPPERLYVSGRRAPTLPNLDPPLHPLPDREFIAELKRRFAGLPAVILAEPELLALFLPILRADLMMLERHEFRTDAVLDVPITAYGGQDDPQTLPEALAAWRELTTREFAMRHFPGGHFYLHEQRERFLPYLAGELSRRLPAV
ncbi:MAG: alpha/beta fold hydrolase [Candidatus Contendobacter sp.]|nr:alpha/beta fold hydrolase [Candidatus Contendobacter sp.]